MSDRVPSEDPVLRTVRAAKEYVVRTEQDLQAIKTPHTIYEAAVASVKNNISQAFQHLPSASSPGDVCRLRDDIVRYGGELKELEYQHKATLRDKEVAYAEQRRSVLEKLCLNLVTILGLPLVESKVQALSNRGPSDGRAGFSRTCPGRTRTESSQRPTPLAAEHEPTTGATYPTTSRGTTNHKRMSGEVSPSSQRKRLRGRSVHFDQVFKNGQAQNKRIIVQYPKENGRWYILRCDEHDLDFVDKPVVLGGAHIRSVEHGKLSRETGVVIEHFGTEVLGCDTVMAEKNNAVARASFQMARPGGQTTSTGDEPSSTHPGRNRTQSCRDTSSGGNRRSHRGREPVLDPTPGEVYLAFWGKAKKRWAVLLLPTKNISDVGVPGTPESLGLTGKVPTCYNYDRRTKEFKWAEGYEDGGALVARREFPVLYFDGRRKPGVGWLGARDLMLFDVATAADVPHMESVREYLQRRARRVLAGTPASSVDGDGAGQEETSPSPRAGRHKPDVPPSHGSEASTVPQTDPSDGQRDTRYNPDTAANDQNDQSDSPPKEQSEGGAHANPPHVNSQATVPEPTAGKQTATPGECGPVNQRHDTDATVGSHFSGVNLTKMAQDAQRTAGREKRPSPAAQDARSSPTAHASRNPILTPPWEVQPSSVLCEGGQGIAPGKGHPPNSVNSKLPSHQHPWLSGAVADPRDLSWAHHSTNNAGHRAREPEEDMELVRGPLGQLRRILPASNPTIPLHLPPIRPLQGTVGVPQLERLPSLLRPAPPAPVRPETPAQGNRSTVLLKPVAVSQDDPSSRAPKKSTVTTTPTSSALDDLSAPGNISWPLDVPNRLLDRLVKYSKNSYPRPDDFRNARNLYHCPLCHKEFARPGAFTKHLLKKH